MPLDNPLQQSPFNPFASMANLLGGNQQGPTPTIQQNQQQGMTPNQLASLRDYIKQLQKHNQEGFGVTNKPGLAALGKVGESLVTGLMENQANQAEKARYVGVGDETDAAVKALTNSGSTGTPPVAPSRVGSVGSPDDVKAITQTAGELGIDPRTLSAVLSFESNFNPNDVGPSGKGYPVKG